jgi:hypothetical protein
MVILKESLNEATTSTTVTATEWKEIEKVALNTLKFKNIRTLKNQGSDEKDFHELSVWTLEKLLKDAYSHGKMAASN